MLDPVVTSPVDTRGSAPAVAAALASASAERLGELRDRFRREHHLKIPGFVDAELADRISAQLAAAEFEVRTSAGVGTEWLMKPNALAATLNWVVNAPDVLRNVRHVAECPEIAYFSGRVYRMDPASGQSFGWHDDRHAKDRRLALSVNLGDEPYAGGVLQLREKTRPDAIVSVPNVARGDAVLFRVADELEHRVTPVEGTVPKLAFTGWFKPGEPYHAALRLELFSRLRGPASAGAGTT